MDPFGQDVILLSSDDDDIDLDQCRDIEVEELKKVKDLSVAGDVKKRKLEMKMDRPMPNNPVTNNSSKSPVVTSNPTSNSISSGSKNGDIRKHFMSVSSTVTKAAVNGNSLTQSQVTAYFQTKNRINKPETAYVKRNANDTKHSHSSKQPASSWRSFGSNKNNAVSKTAPNADKPAGQDPGSKYKKQCPFYKKIPDTPFTVDAFRYGTIDGCKCYFLSHFHYDHYMGLTKRFQHKVYCSKITANLVINQLRVPPLHVVILPMEQQTLVEGVNVTLLDANHCPGSVLFLFEFSDGKKVLHTGDFRASKELEKYEHFLQSGINTVYLDTTYCNPLYTFPRQQKVIQFAIDCTLETLKWNKRTLIVCGTYTIGKERVFHALGKTVGCQIAVTKSKKKILDCLEWKELDKMLTTDFKQAKIHVLSMNALSLQALQDHLAKYKDCFDALLAFKPTGWTFSQKIEELSDIKPAKRGAVTLYGLPYSEHSSYNELEWFIKYVKPDRILPTVNNGDPAKRKAMEEIFKDWIRK